MHIVVTGPIGAGKTCIIDYLRTCNELGGVEIHDEPVAHWLDEGWIEDFYGNPKAMALSFQIKVLTGQVEMQRGIRRDAVVVSERSPLDGRDVFVPMLSELGLMTDRERQAYDLVWNACGCGVGTRPNVIVFVHASDETCRRRVDDRGRHGESGDEQRDYMRRQHAAYQRALERWRDIGIPCIELDNDADGDIATTAAPLMKALAPLRCESSPPRSAAAKAHDAARRPAGSRMGSFI